MDDAVCDDPPVVSRDTFVRNHLRMLRCNARPMDQVREGFSYLLPIIFLISLLVDTISQKR